MCSKVIICVLEFRNQIAPPPLKYTIYRYKSQENIIVKYSVFFFILYVFFCLLSIVILCKLVYKIHHSFP